VTPTEPEWAQVRAMILAEVKRQFTHLNPCGSTGQNQAREKPAGSTVTGSEGRRIVSEVSGSNAKGALLLECNLDRRTRCSSSKVFAL
jgi:hypothetical protein